MKKSKTCRICGEKLPNTFIVDRCVRCALKAEAGKKNEKKKRQKCDVCGHIGIGMVAVNNSDIFSCPECYGAARRI